MAQIPDATIEQLKTRYVNLVADITNFQTTRPPEMMESMYKELEYLKDQLDGLGVEFGTTSTRRFTRVVKGYN